MEVCFHEFEDKVEIFIVVCLNDVVQFNYVGVGQFVEIADFSEGALCVDGVLEGIKYLFEC